MNQERADRLVSMWLGTSALAPFDCCPNEVDARPCLDARGHDGPCINGRGDEKVIIVPSLDIVADSNPAYRLRNDSEGSFRFLVGGDEWLRVEPNGDAFVRGRRVDTDRAVYEGFRDWLMRANTTPPPPMKDDHDE